MSSLIPFSDARTRLLGADLGFPISWPNEPFVNPEPPSIWLAVEMVGNFYKTIELGGDVWQEDGTFYVHVVTPTGTGTDDARTAAKAVADIFREVQTGNITYLGGSIGEGHASDPDGMWWLLTVTVNWRYYDIND